jgi:hypothetical protein
MLSHAGSMSGPVGSGSALTIGRKTGATAIFQDRGQGTPSYILPALEMLAIIALEQRLRRRYMSSSR